MPQPTVTIPLRMPKADAERLDSLAAEHSTTRAALIRRALDLLFRLAKRGKL